MTNEEAWLYAAQWGSYICDGDPGACMYGFNEDFLVQSESHRADCIAEMEQNRARVESEPHYYEDDEIEQIDALVEKLLTAKVDA